MNITSVLLQATELNLGDTQESIRLIELMTKGGYMMIPLVLLWIFSVYIFVERILIIKSSSKTPPSFKESIKEKVLDGKMGEAKILCSQVDTPVARMIEVAVIAKVSGCWVKSTASTGQTFSHLPQSRQFSMSSTAVCGTAVEKGTRMAR